MGSINLEVIRENLGSFGFLADPSWWGAFHDGTKRVLIVLTFIFLAGSIWILIKMWPMRQRLYVLEGLRVYKSPKKLVSFEEEQKRANRKRWDAIIKKAENLGQAGYPMAIIEADIMLEEIMGRLGFLGKNLAERLRSTSPGELAGLNDIWEAHKLRNRIAHEPDFRPSREETTRALGAYKKALQDLKVI